MHWPPRSPRSPGQVLRRCGKRPSRPNEPHPALSPAAAAAPWTGPVSRAVRAAIGLYRDGGSIVPAIGYAWLALVLTRLRIRDDAWARMDPNHRDAHRRLWTDVVRRAQPGYVAAPACLLAFTAWQGGEGALANIALDRALADDPAYSMALLLRDILDAGSATICRDSPADSRRRRRELRHQDSAEL